MRESQHITDFVELFNRLLEAKNQPRLSDGQCTVLSDLLRDMSRSPRQAALSAWRAIEQAGHSLYRPSRNKQAGPADCR